VIPVSVVFVPRAARLVVVAISDGEALSRTKICPDQQERCVVIRRWTNRPGCLGASERHTSDAQRVITDSSPDESLG
jgi:hypothetical protein